MSSRRGFIGRLAGTALVWPLAIRLTGEMNSCTPGIPDQMPDWQAVRKQFLCSENSVAQLNSGSSGNMPVPVLEKYNAYTREINAFAPYDVLDSWNDSIEENMIRLATLVKAGRGEIALVRNTTEAINIILSGIHWNAGDEILATEWDYPFVDYSFNRISENYGVEIRRIPGRAYQLSDEEIIKSFEERTTDKTRLILLTMMTHREGQILPVKEICRIAKAHNTEVMVDGAHMVGQMPVDLHDLDCDYFASSLHKWLNAPLGSGLLYINEKAMENHKPFLSYDIAAESRQLRYTYLGTRAYQNAMSLGDAIDFLNATGLENKQMRLHALNRRWMNELSDTEGVEIHTDPERSCAVAALSINNLSGSHIKSVLINKFSVHVKSTAYPGQPMIRISPNIFTSEEEIDRLVEGVRFIARQS